MFTRNTEQKCSSKRPWTEIKQNWNILQTQIMWLPFLPYQHIHYACFQLPLMAKSSSRTWLAPMKTSPSLGLFNSYQSTRAWIIRPDLHSQRGYFRPGRCIPSVLGSSDIYVNKYNMSAESKPGFMNNKWCPSLFKPNTTLRCGNRMGGGVGGASGWRVKWKVDSVGRWTS